MTEETKVTEGQEQQTNTENTAEQNEQSAQQGQNEGNTASENTPNETEILSAKFNEVNDKYLRLYSDFENFRKQKNKEIIALMQSAGSDVIKELLPVLDDFERAIQVNEKVEDAAALKEGFSLIYNKFKSTLERQGLKEMEAKGAEFDVDLHEALTNIPAPSDELKGKVVDVAEKGYFHKEKVLRYAKVIVGQ